MADSPFQEIAALLREIHTGVDEFSRIRITYDQACRMEAAASTLDRFAEVLATMPEKPIGVSDNWLGWPDYNAQCAKFVARLRALSSPLTETTDT